MHAHIRSHFQTKSHSHWCTHVHMESYSQTEDQGHWSDEETKSDKMHIDRVLCNIDIKAT